MFERGPFFNIFKTQLKTKYVLATFEIPLVYKFTSGKFQNYKELQKWPKRLVSTIIIYCAKTVLDKVITRKYSN